MPKHQQPETLETGSQLICALVTFWFGFQVHTWPLIQIGASAAAAVALNPLPNPLWKSMTFTSCGLTNDVVPKS